MMTVQKQEALRLRNEERKSLGEIARILGLNKSTVHYWLQHKPLTPTESALARKKQGETYKCRARERRLANESKYHQLVAGVELSRARKCRIAEAAVLFRLVLHGFKVFDSPFEGDSADWLVLGENGRALRVQVKWMRRGNCGMPSLNLTRSCSRQRIHRRYADSEIDIMVGYDLYTDTAYVYTMKELTKTKKAKAVEPEAAEQWNKLRS